MVSINTNFGKKMMKRRKQLKKTHESLAAEINVSRKSVEHWEKGTVLADSIKAINVANLCTALQCDFSYLFGDQPFPRKEETDIIAATGLSETGIEKLLEINKKRSTVIGSAKIMILNAILEDENFLNEAASLLYDYAMIPDDAFVNVEFLDKKRDLALISSLKSSDSGDIRRLYMAQLQNVIFIFLNEQFKK